MIQSIYPSLVKAGLTQLCAVFQKQLPYHLPPCEHPAYVIAANCNITHITLFSLQSTLWTTRVFHMCPSASAGNPTFSVLSAYRCVRLRYWRTSAAFGQCVRATLQRVVVDTRCHLSMCWCKPLSIGICINISISLYYEFSIFPIFLHIFCSFFYLLTKCNLHTWYFHW